ncbi:septum formation family protein [Aeromicrobium sp. Leaf350]|uniref:septum formation family protein n=1 Tax=Aeromicrobium sp. Leaf350 TaxID=2876565 RepID=UPI001E3EB02B|nr:septum formation family protein [Aeromicrobium sp. Leaf350]
MGEIPPIPSGSAGFSLPKYPDLPENWSQRPAGPVRPPDDRSEGTATAALVLALIPSVLTNVIGFCLAISVLNKPYGGRFNGRGKAVAALVIAPIWLIITVFLLVLPSLVEPDRGDDGAVIDEGRISTFDLRVGDCLEQMGPEGEQAFVDVVPCDEPHQAEVYHRFELPDTPWPGEEEILRFADGGCASSFTTWSGSAIETTILEGFYYYPIRSSWSTDRFITCVVSSPEPTTGTLEGSGR